ncbi:EAL domain-containing protein [Dokdonella sp.]|uniref:EAL domain-containing response regulator n=1 Tax=Dokdonella sp. TaxID=2291710 RepID=UPI0031BF36E9|nr:EAL domain-containing protein [Dokdonella sp.]
MTRDNTFIQLLIVDDSVDDAERTISALRNGGIAVRPSRATNEAELEAAFAEHIPDLIIANVDCKGLDLNHIREAIARTGRDIGLIACAGDSTPEIVVRACSDGASAFLIRDSQEHIRLVVEREFEALSTRRSVRRLEALLRESERRSDALLDSSRDPIAFVHEGMHVRANKAYLEMFGFDDFEDIEGMSILDMIAPEEAADFKTLLQRLSRGEKPPQRLNLKGRHSDASTFDATMEFAQASFEGEPCQQITFRRQIADAAELDALRSRDLITDLYNRQHMLGEIDQRVGEAGTGRTDQALLLVEPDDFKHVLDTIGIGNADVLLGDLASLLRTHLGESDIAGRVADHSFGVLVNPRDGDQARQMAEHLRSAFSERIFEVGKQSISLTVSIGGTMIGEKSANAANVLAMANTALRSAQDEGGNRVAIVDPSEEDRAAAESAKRWQVAIDEALANNGFVLYYQPIISLHGAEGDFYEILLRMKGPKGEILPNQFMAAAERAGKLPAIDRWVIANAIRALAERERSGQRTTFFVKLTPQSLDDQTLLPWIAQQLKTSRQRGDALVFEMPESKVVTSLKPARAFAKGLEQLRCGFALEQFGSGLNSFQLLKHVPVNYLKIDRTFMAGLPQNKDNQERVRDICEQAHHAGKLTVAEFVEDAASMSILFNCGVNFVQGNFLQEPEKILSHGA